MLEPHSEVRVRAARVVLLLAILLGAVFAGASTAWAQGYSGGPGRRDMQGPPDSRREVDPHMLALIRADDPNNPITLMSAARSDLRLSDSEVTALSTIQMELQRDQAAARTALDTLGPNPRASSIDFAHLTPGGRDSLIAHRKAVAAANGQLHDAAITARQHALAILSPDQQRQFLDLEQRVRIERDTPHDTGEKKK